jgi:hypothetical protein
MNINELELCAPLRPLLCVYVYVQCMRVWGDREIFCLCVLGLLVDHAPFSTKGAGEG